MVYLFLKLLGELFAMGFLMVFRIVFALFKLQMVLMVRLLELILEPVKLVLPVPLGLLELRFKLVFGLIGLSQAGGQVLDGVLIMVVEVLLVFEIVVRLLQLDFQLGDHVGTLFYLFVELVRFLMKLLFQVGDFIFAGFEEVFISMLKLLTIVMLLSKLVLQFLFLHLNPGKVGQLVLVVLTFGLVLLRAVLELDAFGFVFLILLVELCLLLHQIAVDSRLDFCMLFGVFEFVGAGVQRDPEMGQLAILFFDEILMLVD